MSAPSAISGDFATYRHVQGRKVLQLVIEVPAESAAAVFAALGTPGAGEGIPIALARLAKPTVSQPETVQKPRTPFPDLPRAQQAAMRCNEPDFQRFIFETRPDLWSLGGPESSDRAAAVVRRLCGVISRSNILSGTLAAEHWDHLEAEFFAHSRGMR